MILKVTLTLIVLLSSTSAFTLSSNSDRCTQKFGEVDAIYHNGNIITVDDELPIAGAVGIKNGTITKVIKNKLSLLDVASCKGKLIDLNGKSMVPGFVDSHSHFGGSAVAVNLGFTIRSSPFGNVSSISDMVQNARNYIKSTNLPAGKAVYSFGYSDYAVSDRRHPTKYELDAVSTVHPVVFEHYSGHLLAANTYAMEAAGYFDNSTEPSGGVFDRYPNGSLTGVFRENAMFALTDLFQMRLAMLNKDQILKGVDAYLSSGVTTVQSIFFTIKEAQKYK